MYLEVIEGKVLVSIEYGHTEQGFNKCFITTDKEPICYIMHANKQLVNGEYMYYNLVNTE